jgi:hypothetical protein
MVARMPKHRRRRKSKSRIDIDRTNANRVTVKNGKLTILSTVSGNDTKVRDKVRDVADFSELIDSNVVLPIGKQTLSIRCLPHHLKDLKHLAKRHNVTLKDKNRTTNGNGQTSHEAFGEQTLDVNGSPDNCRDFANHIAGHSDLKCVSVELVTLAMQSTQTDAHVADAIRYGYTSPPKRIDYSAGKGQPKATYPINGHYSTNDIDHRDTRNNGKRAGMFAPKIAHTEH